MAYGQTTGTGSSSDYDSQSNAKQAVESPISRELNVLTKNIAELEQIVSSLGSRLTPVTIQQPPRPANTDKPGIPTQGNGTVCEAIAASNQRIGELTRHVMELRDCLAI